MKKIYVGKEGSGKTLLLGREAKRIVYRNINLAKRTGIMRPIISNIAFSETFISWAEGKGAVFKKWQHIAELETLTECDLFIDEVSAYFDSRTFADLPLSTRLWLAQAQKLGVYIYGGAQDWAQIDVSFRRLVTKLILVKKVLGTRRPSRTLPGGKYPLALGLTWELDPNPTANQEDVKSISFFPSPILMTKIDTNRFDTNARVALSEPPPLVKIVRVCPEDGFKRTKYI